MRPAGRRHGLPGLARRHPRRSQPGAAAHRRRDRGSWGGAHPPRVRQHGQAVPAHDGRGTAAGHRPDPVLRRRRAGARRTLGGGVHAGTHLVRPARAGRGVRAGHAVELPDDDGGVEVRAGARRREHRGAQAVRHHAGVDGVDGPADAGVPAARGHERRLRRPRHRPGVGDPRRSRSSSRSPDRSERAGRSPSPWRGTSRSPTSSSVARPPSSSSTTRTSRLAAEGIAGAGYFNAGQDCTAASRVLAGPHPRRVGRRPRRAGTRDPHRSARGRARLRPAQQRRSSSPGCGGSSIALPTTPRWSPGATHWPATASSSNRRSSPGSSRTTR
jgi:hypothetical protein